MSDPANSPEGGPANSEVNDLGRKQTMLISFESGHYKKVTGAWKGDSIWTHWVKTNGKCVHINKDKVEYYEELEEGK